MEKLSNQVLSLIHNEGLSLADLPGNVETILTKVGMRKAKIEKTSIGNWSIISTNKVNILTSKDLKMLLSNKDFQGVETNGQGKLILTFTAE